MTEGIPNRESSPNISNLGLAEHWRYFLDTRGMKFDAFAFRFPLSAKIFSHILHKRGVDELDEALVSEVSDEDINKTVELMLRTSELQPANLKELERERDDAIELAVESDRKARKSGDPGQEMGHIVEKSQPSDK